MILEERGTTHDFDHQTRTRFLFAFSTLNYNSRSTVGCCDFTHVQQRVGVCALETSTHSRSIV